MEFRQDDFIFHPTYGVGRVITVHPFFTADPLVQRTSDSDEITIAFGQAEPKAFTRYLLERGGQKLHPEGFRAFAFLDPAGAVQKLKEQPVDVILMSLQDFPRMRAVNDDFKEYLAPYLEDWKTWWEKVQPLLKDDARIDTTRAKFREYGINLSNQSAAEQKYHNFLRYKANETPARVYALARSTLDLIQKGQTLEPGDREVLETYLLGVPGSDRYSIPDRIDAFLRLKDANLLPEVEVNEGIDKLLPLFRLYQLNEFASNRLRDYLFTKPSDPGAMEMLASGICGTGALVESIQDWALQRGDMDLVGRMLVLSFLENIPPELTGDRYKFLAARLKACVRLARALSPRDPRWLEVLSNFKNMLAVASQQSFEEASVLFDPLAAFSVQVYSEFDGSGDIRLALLQALLQPIFPLKFLMTLLQVIQKARAADKLYQEMETYLWQNGAEFGFEFIRDLRMGDTLQKATALASLAGQYDNPLLREKTGQELCAILRDYPAVDLPLLLPALEIFINLPGSWTWSSAMEGLCEMAYFELLQRRQPAGPANRPLVSAVARYVDYRAEELKKNQKYADLQLEEARTQLANLESQIANKDVLIDELRSGFGDDTSDARFEERSRILKDLAGSLAEFERISLARPDQLNGVEPILLRFFNLFKGLQAIPMEEIGTQVKFNPQKHKMIDSVHVDTGETVVIFERGFLIRDFKEKLRLLKPALVRK